MAVRKSQIHNEIGVFDMSGNVFEFCWDWYDGSYDELSPLRNPYGPLQGEYRVRRGGCYNHKEDYKVHQRGWCPSYDRDRLYGFRLCRTISSRCTQTQIDSATEELKVLLNDSTSFEREKIYQVIKAGANINVMNEQNVTPLLRAAGEDYVEIVKLLLSENANVNIPRRYTPLWNASYKGHTEIVKLLLQADGINVEDSPQGNTPLIVAACYGHKEVVELLLSANAKVDARCYSYNASPLMWAAQEGHTEIVKILLSANAKVNFTNKESGLNAFAMASQNGHTEIVRLLLGANANVNYVNKINGTTALCYASGEGYTEVVKLLINANANVNLGLVSGATPLHFASEKGHLEVVMLLLSAGADENITAKVNGQELTPLKIAEAKKHTEIAKLLQSKNRIINSKENITDSNPDNKSIVKINDETYNVTGNDSLFFATIDSLHNKTIKDVNVILYIANLSLKLEKYNKALHYFNISLEMYQHLDAIEKQVEVMKNIYTIFKNIGTENIVIDSTVNLYKMSYMKAKEYKNQELLLYTCSVLIQIAIKNKNLKNALFYTDDFLQLAKEENRELAVAEILVARGSIYGKLKNFNEAKNAF